MVIDMTQLYLSTSSHIAASFICFKALMYLFIYFVLRIAFSKSWQMFYGISSFSRVCSSTEDQ